MVCVETFGRTFSLSIAMLEVCVRRQIQQLFTKKTSSIQVETKHTVMI